MVFQTLVTADLERSHRIVERLERDGIHIALAFWATLAEYGDWRLFLAGPQLDELGLFQAYGRIAGAGLADEVYNEPLIVILHMNDPLAVGLLNRYGGRDVRGLRIAGQSFGPRSIEDGVLEKAA